MKPSQCGFKVSFLLSMIFLCVNGQLKFDADGNIIDDGLNLNIPAAPTVQKRPLVAKSKPQPLVAKSRPQPDRVVGNAEEKDTEAAVASDLKDATLDELLQAAGLNSQGQKLDAPKADKVAESQSDANAIGNLSPDDLKSLLANHLASQKEKAPTNAAQKKPAEGLNQVPGAAASVPKKPAADDTIEKATEAVNPLPENIPTEATVDEEPQPQLEEENEEFQEGEQIELYPWQSEICKDYDEAACSAFKPMCNIMGVIAHRKCRKTCKLCIKDKPKSRTLDAKLKEFSLTLTQNGPQAPSFLTVCIESSAASKYGLPDTAMSLVIHSYGDANEDTCENFGPHFNPFGVQHGHPEDVTKHVGDLGVLEFRKVPDEWPEDVAKCSSSQIGSYGVFDHINLYGENSPCQRPIVLYKGEAPMKEFKPSLAVACDVLKEPYGDAKEDTKTKPTAALLNANRVTEAKKGKDLMNKVPYVKEANKPAEAEDAVEAIATTEIPKLVTQAQKKKKTTMKPKGKKKTMKPNEKKPTKNPSGKIATTTTMAPKITDDKMTTDDIIATKIKDVENQTKAAEETENDDEVDTAGDEKVTEKSSEESVESEEK